MITPYNPVKTNKTENFANVYPTAPSTVIGHIGWLTVSLGLRFKSTNIFLNRNPLPLTQFHLNTFPLERLLEANILVISLEMIVIFGHNLGLVREGANLSVEMRLRFVFCRCLKLCTVCHCCEVKLSRLPVIPSTRKILVLLKVGL